MTVLQDAYLSAIKSMSDGPPKPVERRAFFEAEEAGEPAGSVTMSRLAAYLQQTSGNDPLYRAIHLAIATWDVAAAAAWTTTPASTTARRSEIYDLLALDTAARAQFDKSFPLSGDGTVIISDEFEAWYSADRRDSHAFYWPAYARQLANNGWQGPAIAKLDLATSQVVERLSDPARIQAYQSKGLVVGYVQSGKTANFTGVIAKAIDAGYRLVIVLTGTVDLLRKQTQRRLDMELVGIENIFLGIDPDDAEQARDVDYYTDADRISGKFLTHGFHPPDQGFTGIVRLTRHGSDYRSLNAGITALEIQKRDKQRPLYDAENLYHSDARLAIVKKNASVLRRLVRDLKSIRSHLGEIPTLIIDDESDQASVNTSNPARWREDQVERTAINALISELLSLLPRAQYVGYTATPYANVFIDPQDSEDIFPRDFLLNLERPDGYMGVSDFHDLEAGFDDGEKTVANSNERAYVRDLVAQGDESEPELRRAIDAFVLSGALKLYRQSVEPGLKFRHHTMLIHESVRMSEHRLLAEDVKRIWSSAGYMTPAGLDRLGDLLESDYRPVSASRGEGLPFPASIDELSPFVGQALSKVQSSDGNPVLVVNGDKDIDQQNLDFQMNEIWRILIGGTKLSRGFTVEGLTVSYYRRKTKQADTLMQMGRWFGFRRGYQDLVRLYIGRAEPDGRTTLDLYEAFEAIVRDEEAFRRQLQRYAELVDGRPQLTPRDIPPLVSQHLPGIRPAAANKMFNAELVVRRSPGEPIEPVAYPEAGDAMNDNYRLLAPMLRAASELKTFTFPGRENRGGALVHGGQFDALVGLVDAATVYSALSQHRWLTDGYFAPDLAYLEEITGDTLQDWVVIAPVPTEGTPLADMPIVGGPRIPWTRRRRRGPSFGALSDPKHRPPAAVIAGAVASYGDAEADALARPKRGAMILYTVVEPERPRDQITLAFTLYCPASATGADSRVVQFRARDASSPRRPIVDAR